MTVLLVPWGVPLWRAVLPVHARNGITFSILTGRAGGIIFIQIN
jgi:hypothetical protein